MYLALQVLAAAQALEKAGQRLFRPHGLTVAQFNVLNLLCDQPGGMRVTALSTALVVDPSNITGLLKRMKAEGLLKELESPQDRRQHVVALSPRGQRKWRAAHAEYQARLESLEASIGPADRKGTERALARMIAGSAAA